MEKRTENKPINSTTKRVINKPKKKKQKKETKQIHR